MTLKVGVIGAGSLGTALSQTISENVDQLRGRLCVDVLSLLHRATYYRLANARK